MWYETENGTWIDLWNVSAFRVSTEWNSYCYWESIAITYGKEVVIGDFKTKEMAKKYIDRMVSIINTDRTSAD